MTPYLLASAMPLRRIDVAFDTATLDLRDRKLGNCLAVVAELIRP